MTTIMTNAADNTHGGVSSQSEESPLAPENLPPYFTAACFASVPGLRHGFFTRLGGITTDSCRHTLDVSSRALHPEREINIHRAVGSLMQNTASKGATEGPCVLPRPLPLCLRVHQVHGATCHSVTTIGSTPTLDSDADTFKVPYIVGNDASNHKAAKESPLQECSKEYPKGDALVTTLPNVLASVITADCVPLLLVDPTHKVVGAVHAGWRGALQGVVPSALRAMERIGADRKLIRAAIGPSIHQRHYEVGEEVYQAFQNGAPDPSQGSMPLGHTANARYYAGRFFHRSRENPSKNKWLFDLRGMVAWELKLQGVRCIEVLPYDTYSNPSTFYSCRRATHLQKPTYGCQIAMVGFDT